MSPDSRALRVPQAPGIGRRLLSMLYESFVVFAIMFFARLALYGAANGRLSGGTRHAFQLYLFLCWESTLSRAGAAQDGLCRCKPGSCAWSAVKSSPSGPAEHCCATPSPGLRCC